jgi:putative ABC transport system permease protein
MPFLRDLKIAVRSLSRVPSLWMTVALTLALGIGANAAIFSVVRTVLLRPLANRDEDRLLYLRQSAPGIHIDNATFSVPEIDDLGKHLRTITELGTFSEIDFTLHGLGQPREIPAGVVDGHYFEVMGLKPILGRLLGPSDDGPNAQGAVVLTYKFWTESMHSDPAVLGKTIRLDSFAGSRTATIVGVLEPAVPYPVATEIIANVVTSPHHLSATMVTGREHRMTEVFARLAPGSTLDQARAELRTDYAAMLQAHPEVYKHDDQYQISVRRMHDQINARANTVLWVLFAASALLFVIACSNVANLVLARTLRRESELAVRSALGATTATLRRSLLAESLVLCGSGVAAALLIAAPMVAILGRYAARFSVRADGLMRTLYDLESTRPPFDSSHVLAVNLPIVRYGRTPQQIEDFNRETARRVAALPGVKSVAYGFSVPWRDTQTFAIRLAFAVDGAIRKNADEDVRGNFRSISPGYFSTLGVPLLEGRDFRDSDKEGADRVVIISQSVAKNLFPGQEAIGRNLRWTDGVIKFIGISPENRRIVGVVPDIDDENIIPNPAMTVYQPVDQEGWAGRLFVRTEGDPYPLVPSITRTIQGIAADQPVERAATLDDVRAEVLTPDKLNAVVFGGFAAVALLISVVGVAGVLAFSVSGRTREFGIRMALGAQPRNILTDVLREGLVIAGIGVVAGLVLGFAFARGIGAYVGQVHLPGALTFIGSAAVILAAAAIASAVPAARAARVNAVEALRAE